VHILREISWLAEEAAFSSSCLQLDAQLNSGRTRYIGNTGSCHVRTNPRRSGPFARQRIDKPRQFRRLLPDWRKAACSARPTRPTYRLNIAWLPVTSNVTMHSRRPSAVTLTFSLYVHENLWRGSQSRARDTHSRHLNRKRLWIMRDFMKLQ